MIRLVHLDRSRSERIIWLLEELGLPYTLDAFQRRPDLYGRKKSGRRTCSGGPL